jgi:hypothetical protein
MRYGAYIISSLAYAILVLIGGTKHPTTLFCILFACCLVIAVTGFLYNVIYARNKARAQLAQADIDCQGPNHNLYSDRIHVVYEEYDKYMTGQLIAWLATMMVAILFTFISTQV